MVRRYWEISHNQCPECWAEVSRSIEERPLRGMKYSCPKCGWNGDPAIMGMSELRFEKAPPTRFDRRKARASGTDPADLERLANVVFKNWSAPYREIAQIMVNNPACPDDIRRGLQRRLDRPPKHKIV